MKKLLTLLFAFIPLLLTAQNTDGEANAYYGYASDSYNERTDSVMPIRYIDGGTVFIVKYSEDCDFEMQSAFNHACRILEERVPNCPPLTVSVS